MPTYTGTDGNDLLTGSTFDDKISGLAGDDLIDDGGGGADELNGGSGNDQYNVRDPRASVVELPGGGYDIINTNLARYFLPANVERLIYTALGDFVGVGNALDNTIDGGGGNDSLSGGDGADLLRGGAGNDILDGGIGLDTMIGGSGDDRYYVDVAGDSVIEQSGGGVDTVIVGATIARFTLSAEVENLFYAGTAAFVGIGNAGSNVLVAGAANDVLSGEGGRDELYGLDGDDTLLGGTGAANTLIGGSGNDTYYVDAVGDTVIERVGEGTDRVLTTLSSYTLTDYVENLIYNGAGDFTGRGNALNNTIVGGPGADWLSSGGGFDTLVGGDGNDTYDMRDLGGLPTLIETANGGIDTIYTPYGGTIPANIENWTIAYSDGPLTVTGNALNNVIIATREDARGAYGPRSTTMSGMDGNDTLIGGQAGDTLDGGAGNDELIGAAGNDRYVNVDAGDTIVELANEGVDSVETALSRYTLSANLENLRYTGSAAFTGTGNAASNLLVGSTGNDTLSGLDGADVLAGLGGADTLAGGGGADTFYYQRGETGLDHILDFTSGTDRIALDQYGFSHTATVDYVAGAAPTSTNSTFLYDAATGLVSYDADGTGTGTAIQLTRLSAGLTLTGADFVFTFVVL